MKKEPQEFIAAKGNTIVKADETPKPGLTKDEARKLTDDLKHDTQRLWMRLADLYQRGAHIALGYSSWDKYMENEFLILKGQAYRMLRAARVVEELAAVSPGDTTLQYEKHARELSVLREPKQIAAAWDDAQDQAAERGTPVTSKDVRAAVQKVRGPLPPPPAKPAPPAAKPARDEDIAEQSTEHLRQVDFLAGQFSFSKTDASKLLTEAAQLDREEMVVNAAIGL